MNRGGQASAAATPGNSFDPTHPAAGTLLPIFGDRPARRVTPGAEGAPVIAEPAVVNYVYTDRLN